MRIITQIIYTKIQNCKIKSDITKLQRNYAINPNIDLTSQTSYAKRKVKDSESKYNVFNSKLWDESKTGANLSFFEHLICFILVKNIEKMFLLYLVWSEPLTSGVI